MEAVQLGGWGYSKSKNKLWISIMSGRKTDNCARSVPSHSLSAPGDIKLPLAAGSVKMVMMTGRLARCLICCIVWATKLVTIFARVSTKRW